MSRRRMMMLQNDSPKFELVYESSSGLLPTDSGEWYYRAGYYSGRAGVGAKPAIVDNQLKLTLNHLYEGAYYTPINHKYATNSELSVTVEKWEKVGWSGYNGQIALIGLTDGNNFAVGSISENGFRLNNYALQTHIVLVNIYLSLEIPESFIFKVKRKANSALYYLNDELIYTQATLPSVDEISYGTDSTRYMLTEPLNFVGASSCVDYISNITYKEW